MKKLIICLLVLTCLAAQAATEPLLLVTGLVSKSLALSMPDLRGFAPAHVSVTQASTRGLVVLDCTGAPLSAILARATPNFGTARNASLAHTVLFTADDGYAVALSMGEIDPDYGHVAALIATDCSDKALDAPRLIVPGDGHGGRAANGIVKIEIK